jgi:hypothetical protein
VGKGGHPNKRIPVIEYGKLGTRIDPDPSVFIQGLFLDGQRFTPRKCQRIPVVFDVSFDLLPARDIRKELVIGFADYISFSCKTDKVKIIFIHRYVSELRVF